MNKIGFFIIFTIVLMSCQSNTIYNKYQTIDQAKWRQNQVLEFTIPIQDTIDRYNLFINLRNNNEYPYSNLFLITMMVFPDNTQVIDTLEYEMTDTSGKFLGSGFSDLKENKLFYKEKVQFNKSGKYKFYIKQALRKRNKVTGVDPLKGVTDVGISIEKIE